MSARIATLVLAAAVALVAGTLLGAWLASTRSAARVPRAAELPAPARDELAPVLAELARALVELRAVLATRPALPTPVSVAPAREVADPAARTSHDPDLAAALQALAASLRGLGRETGAVPGASGSSGLVVPTFVDRARAFSGVGLREAVEADDELAWERAMDAFRKKHLFWTTQQVLDAYGKPDEIEVGDQYSTWSYRLPVPPDGEDVYVFLLSDGLVFSAEYSD